MKNEILNRIKKYAWKEILTAHPGANLTEVDDLALINIRLENGTHLRVKIEDLSEDLFDPSKSCNIIILSDDGSRVMIMCASNAHFMGCSPEEGVKPVSAQDSNIPTVNSYREAIKLGWTFTKSPMWTEDGGTVGVCPTCSFIHGLNKEGDPRG